MVPSGSIIALLLGSYVVASPSKFLMQKQREMILPNKAITSTGYNEYLGLPDRRERREPELEKGKMVDTDRHEIHEGIHGERPEQ